MNIQIFLAYLPYCLITTFTPGPNNLMSFYSVSNYGWRNGLKIISGIATGYIVGFSICAILCNGLAIYIPEITRWLKYVGVIYMLWLAVHIAISKPSNSNSAAVKFSSGFFLAITNVKVLLYFITIYTAYAIPAGADLIDLFIHGFATFILAIISWTLWACAGGLLQKFLTRHYRIFNIIMALLLVWCAASLIF